jgi:protein-L-isoaspartate(D-aspartate) O-methyltransferase
MNIHMHIISPSESRLIKGGESILLNSVTSLGMIEKQLKPRGIVDPLVLRAMEEVPRDKFLDQALASGAYFDCSMPIGSKQTMSKPFIVAFMAQALELEGKERVLDIGTGSGYQAAILSKICKSVFSIERIFKFAARAKRLYDELGYSNISVNVGDGYYGWKDYAPYDAIIAAASGTHVPKSLINQLKVGGKLIMPITKDDKSQQLYIFKKDKVGLTKKLLTECSFVKFVNC